MKILFIFALLAQNFLFAMNERESNLFKLLKTDNHFAMIRHAYAPGFGDPDNFNLNIRNTQRNLNNEGINQAKKLGVLFKENGIVEADIYSSYWFRCYETATYMNLGNVKKHNGLNSFFEDHFDENETSKILKDWLRNKDITKPLILVTHQVNISNLTNRYASSGEIVFVKKLGNDKFKVVGSIDTMK